MMFLIFYKFLQAVTAPPHNQLLFNHIATSYLVLSLSIQYFFYFNLLLW